MVVTATGINNCTALDAQLRNLSGVTYVANDAYACTVNGRMEGLVSGAKYILWFAANSRPPTYSTYYSEKNHLCFHLSPK